jgi:CheY-like chemotaxis protein
MSSPLALVVENDPSTRKLLEVLLARLEIDCDLVGRVADALALLEHVDYDVMFVDLLFSGPNGEAILEWLERERPHALERALVISSASEMHLLRVQARWPGVRVIRKPFELADLISAAQNAIQRPAARETTIESVFCRRSIQAGAKAGLVVRTDGARLVPMLSFGFTQAAIDAFFPMSVDDPYPLCASIRRGQPVWLASLRMASPEYPILSPVWIKNESHALAAVPLLRHGRAIGAAGWGFREPRLFRETEQDRFLSIAEHLSAVVPAFESDTRAGA